MSTFKRILIFLLIVLAILAMLAVCDRLGGNVIGRAMAAPAQLDREAMETVGGDPGTGSVWPARLVIIAGVIGYFVYCYSGDIFGNRCRRTGY